MAGHRTWMAGRRSDVASGAAWLSLAAAPTFALMALLSALAGGAAADALCAPAHGASVLTGMVPMYLLMSGFHLTPWLKLVATERGGGDAL